MENIMKTVQGGAGNSTAEEARTLTLNPLTWKIWRAPNNVARWQMGFNLLAHEFYI